MGAATDITHIALLHWGDLIEDFLGEIHVTLEEFREQMTGGWMFGFIEALQSAGVRTTLVCVSSRVSEVETWKHLPTGADICVVPSSRPYRRLRRLADLKKSRGTPRRRLARQINRLMEDTLPYLATPVWTVRQQVRKRGCQAILCQEYEHARFDLSVLAGALAGIPVFATFQGGDTRFSRFERLFRRITIGRSAGLIIGSARERERVALLYRGCGIKLAPIFNPLDLSLWYPEDRAAARRALDLPEDALLLIWHGRVDLWRKGLDRLAAAWSEIARARPEEASYLVLIGDGPDSARLRDLIEAGCPARVIWRHQYVLDRSLMRRYLSAADVYALPSRHEGFPVAPLEAMACGLPVVAMECPGVRDIVQRESDGGLVVSSGDAAGLRQALIRLMDDGALRRAMGAQARERVQRCFGFEAVGQELKGFLNVPQLSPGGART